MRYLLILVFMISLFQELIGQDSTVVIIELKIVNSEQIQLDKFNNIFVSTSDRQLIQFDEKGIKKAVYNEIKYGRIGIIDLNNPLNILIYYPDFSIVQILDRNLTLQSEINLRIMGYQTNPAIGLSADNNIWFYNLEKYRLIKLDPTGKILRKSNELIGLIGKSTIAGQIREQDNFLLARAPDFGWMLFDDFGSYIQTLPIPDNEILNLSDDKISYREDDFIKQFDLNNLGTKAYPIPGFMNSENEIQYINQTWIERSTDKIKIYQLK